MSKFDNLKKIIGLLTGAKGGGWDYSGNSGMSIKYLKMKSFNFG